MNVKSHCWNPFNWSRLVSFLAPTFYGGGSGGGNTTSTVNQNNIPPELLPYVESMLGEATNQIFNTQLNPDTGKYDITGVKGYQPYAGGNAEAAVAQFNPLQQQAFNTASGMTTPWALNRGVDFVEWAGGQAGNSAQQALGYGASGARSGQIGRQFGLQSAQNAQNMAQNYGAQALDYGTQGSQSGLLGQGLGVQGGQLYGNAGVQSGLLGQQFGLQSAQNAQNMATNYGEQGVGYGRRAADIGEMALQAQDYGRQIGNQAQNYAAQSAGAGQNYLNQIANPANVQQYMSPYQQAVTDVAKQGALRDFQVAQQMRQSQAARSGAYGGARQAIENAEAQRNLNTQLQTLQTQGSQNAYNQAIQNMGQGTQYGLTGLQGAQTGLNTALSGGQLGLSGIGQAIAGQQAGIQGANTGLSGVGQYLQAGQLGLAGTAQGMQGAQVGLQGVDRQMAGTAQGMQGAQVGLQGVNSGLSGVGQYLQAGQLGLAGTEQGMKGAQVGLQGVQGSQAGYDLANRVGANMADIGTKQLAAQTNIANLQNQYGSQQQQRAQDIINQDILNYTNAQQYPLQQLATYSGLIRGTPLNDSTRTEYGTDPSMLSQLAGAGMTAASAYKLLKKEGGVIKSPKKYKSGGLVDLAIANAMRGA